MRSQHPEVGTTTLTSTAARRWYQFSIWHLLVAMTILSVASSLVARMLKPEPVKVEGCVYMDETPLSSGLITFVDEKKRQRVSRRISNGTYAFSDTIESGCYFVEISSPRATGNVAVETIPPKYNCNTTLKMQLVLVPGTNVVDFSLSSR